ncbi:shikimate dehydrogenase [Helicobacter sp. 16-1353]|uniref:shikimate dehydrogenase n=1 Tax=Helicobacter sp. 16-1353 TaxID=2004996 RepID=UPI000DCED092|nr:shikimate dehydrogenase [Helicobacter sp. 16-1353]RAX54407.1 shikimate dehydrogenase [Helicobacter sp. 16-1353]
MKLFAVFGNPINHSKSPILHNFVFYKLGIDARYIRYLLESSDNFRDLFFSLGLNGANITLPYKESLVKYCDEIRGIAKNIGAINTIVREDSNLIGYNTDGIGFYKNIENENIKNALILGAGGSARVIAFVLRQHNINVNIANRNSKNLDFFHNNGFKVCLNNEIVYNESFDIIINATSSSINDSLPIPRNNLENLFSKTNIAFDLMYGRECRFLELAKIENLKRNNLKTQNIKIIDGSKMLLYQAISASSLFLNIEENIIAKPMKEMYSIINL